METIIGTAFQAFIVFFIASAAIVAMLMVATGLFQALALFVRLFSRVIGKPLPEEKAVSREDGFLGALFDGLGLKPKMKFDVKVEDLRRNPA
jgi:hypothetical protein